MWGSCRELGHRVLMAGKLLRQHAPVLEVMGREQTGQMWRELSAIHWSGTWPCNNLVLCISTLSWVLASWSNSGPPFRDGMGSKRLGRPVEGRPGGGGRVWKGRKGPGSVLDGGEMVTVWRWLWDPLWLEVRGLSVLPLPPLGPGRKSSPIRMPDSSVWATAIVAWSAEVISILWGGREVTCADLECVPWCGKAHFCTALLSWHRDDTDEACSSISKCTLPTEEVVGIPSLTWRRVCGGMWERERSRRKKGATTSWKWFDESCGVSGAEVECDWAENRGPNSPCHPHSGLSGLALNVAIVVFNQWSILERLWESVPVHTRVWAAVEAVAVRVADCTVEDWFWWEGGCRDGSATDGNVVVGYARTNIVTLNHQDTRGLQKKKEEDSTIERNWSNGRNDF